MFLTITIFEVILGLGLAIYLVNKLVKKSAAKFLYPKRSLPKESPADYGHYYEEVQFRSADGLQLGGWFIPAKRQDKSTLLFVHGLKGNRGSLLPQANELIARGYGALLIDLRNHGVSQGSVTSMTVQEIFDIEGSISYLKTRTDVNLTNLGVIGHSLGASTAIRAAARQQDIKFVVAQAAFADLCESMHQAARALTGLPAKSKLAAKLVYPFVYLMIRYAKNQVGVEPRSISPLRDLKQMPTKPMLFMHGLNDTTIDVLNSEKLFESAKGDKELILLEDMDHASFRNRDYHKCMYSVIQFVERQTQPTSLKLESTKLEHPPTYLNAERQRLLSI